MSAHAQWEGKMLPGVWKKSVNLEIDLIARYVARLHDVNG